MVTVYFVIQELKIYMFLYHSANSPGQNMGDLMTLIRWFLSWLKSRPSTKFQQNQLCNFCVIVVKEAGILQSGTSGCVPVR